MLEALRSGDGWSDPRAFADGLIALLGPEARRATPGLREGVREVIASAGRRELESFLTRLRSTGESWGYHAPHPLARALSHQVIRAMLEEGSGVANAAALGSATGRPVIFVANHLSFVDANVFELLLSDAGYSELAERLAVVAGPKVFTTPLRRVASLCFGTIKTPQSSSIASGEAVMSPREVARTASRTLRVARERLEASAALLVFLEGTRSRTGGMQRALAGVARYLDRADALVVPFGQTGSDRLTPIDSNERFQRARVVARIGTPLEAVDLVERCSRKRALVMDTLGFLIADCLPVEHRGVYAGNDPRLSESRWIATLLSRRSPETDEGRLQDRRGGE
jgi:1-acyl-sn-glycerol-3-phosphate acyltransferase